MIRKVLLFVLLFISWMAQAQRVHATEEDTLKALQIFGYMLLGVGGVVLYLYVKWRKARSKNR